MVIKSISIIGLGLIGGSLARAFRQEKRECADSLKIYAVDNNKSSIQLAEKEGTIDKGSDDIFPEILDSDVIFICTPVIKTVEYIDQLSGKISPNCIITDVSSTKGEIFQYIEGLERPHVFVGGHPMAGTEKSGYQNSFAHMFQNAYYVLTPTKASSESALAVLTSLLKSIGAIPIIVSAQQHDIVTGCISHVPHIIASALVNLAKDTENEGGLIKLLAAGGFKDITRIASSNPSMWEGIILSNRDIVVDLLNSFNQIVNTIIKNIKASNNKQIFDFLDEAKVYRDSFSNVSAGLIPKSFELLVDVKDEPGTIGKIATLLGNCGINIKNINVSNSREFEQGCLRITLSDQDNTDGAYAILADEGYRVFSRDQ